MSRLAEQPARLDADQYPARFVYRPVYSDMDVNRHLNNCTFGPVPPTEAERETLAKLAFTVGHGPG